MSKAISLADIVLPEESVDIPGTGSSFRVGALSFADIMSIFTAHKAIVGEMYLRFVGNSDAGKMDAVLGHLINDAPQVTASVIAVAAGGAANDADLVAKVGRLSFTVQSEALRKIATLTFGRLEDDAVKKFFVTVHDAIATFNQMVTEASAALPGGSDKSAET